MGLVLTKFTNPWGAPGAQGLAEPGLDPARTDLWTLDLSYVASQLNQRLPGAYAADSSVNNATYYGNISAAMPTAPLASYLARSVQLPSRIMGAGQLIRRDNGAFIAPGYQDNIGRVQVVFAHELAKSYPGSAIWALLTVWRAFARSGQGPDFPGTNDLTFSLSGAGTGVGGVKTLSPVYQYDFVLTLATPVSGNDTGGDTASNGTSLAVGAGYVIKNAWPVEFGLEPVNYEGSRILELRASFQCDDVIADS